MTRKTNYCEAISLHILLSPPRRKTVPIVNDATRKARKTILHLLKNTTSGSLFESFRFLMISPRYAGNWNTCFHTTICIVQSQSSLGKQLKENAPVGAKESVTLHKSLVKELREWCVYFHCHRNEKQIQKQEKTAENSAASC